MNFETGTFLLNGCLYEGLFKLPVLNPAHFHKWRRWNWTALSLSLPHCSFKRSFQPISDRSPFILLRGIMWKSEIAKSIQTQFATRFPLGSLASYYRFRPVPNLQDGTKKMNLMTHTPVDVDTWFRCNKKEKWISAKSPIVVAIHYIVPNLLHRQASLKWLL